MAYNTPDSKYPPPPVHGESQWSFPFDEEPSHALSPGATCADEAIAAFLDDGDNFYSFLNSPEPVRQSEAELKSETAVGDQDLERLVDPDVQVLTILKPALQNQLEVVDRAGHGAEADNPADKTNIDQCCFDTSIEEHQSADRNQEREHKGQSGVTAVDSPIQSVAFGFNAELSHDKEHVLSTNARTPQSKLDPRAVPRTPQSMHSRFEVPRLHRNSVRTSDLPDKNKGVRTGREDYDARKTLMCLKCGAGHTCMFNLIQHERTHTGEKPYGCEICQQRFPRRWGLSRHQRSVHKLDVQAKHGQRGKQRPNPKLRFQGRGSICTLPQMSLPPFHLGLESLQTRDMPVNNVGQPDVKTSDDSLSLDTLMGDCQTPGLDRNDVGAWPIVFIADTPQAHGNFVCSECQVPLMFWNAGELQYHRHMSHHAPLDRACPCQICAPQAWSGTPAQIMPDRSNVDVQPRNTQGRIDLTDASDFDICM